MNKRLEEIRSLLADETNKNLNFDELEKSIKNNLLLQSNKLCGAILVSYKCHKKYINTLKKIINLYNVCNIKHFYLMKIKYIN